MSEKPIKKDADDGISGKYRVTFAIPDEIDNLLEVYCNHTKEQKNIIAEMALVEHLARHKPILKRALQVMEAAVGRLDNWHAAARLTNRKAEELAPDKDGRSKRRVTFMIDKDVDNLLEVYCNHTGKEKNGVTAEAISIYLGARKPVIEQAIAKIKAAKNLLDRWAATAPSPAPVS